ncbi:hypothetical protein [Kribbella swartbergensis]
MTALAVTWFDWTITDAETLLAGVAFLVGGGLAAFGQLGAWRSRLTEREHAQPVELPERDSIDEAVAHLLWSTWIAVVEVPLIVVASETSGSKDLPPILDWLRRGLSGVILGLGVYLLLLLLMAVPKLYSAYVRANRVRDDLNGFRG